MNSDPHDSAAWRTFGMLDAAQTAEFEEAMRRDPELRRTSLEIDRLAAAVAACRAEPVPPSPEQLLRLQRALGHRTGARDLAWWLAMSGWCAAGALAGLLAWRTFPRAEVEAPAIPAAVPPTPHAIVADHARDTRRLMAEIDDLRKDLAEFHERDRAMFQVLPGRALHVVMTLLPPGGEASAPLATTALLGDALAAINREEAEDDVETSANPEEPGAWPAGLEEDPSPPATPMAVPIYDATRDSGTLVVSHLPPAPAGRVYHLWVATGMECRPVYLGKLPDNSASGAETFDFSLGSTMILPTSFMLTLGPADSPAPPDEENTVLAGPRDTTR